MKYPLIPKNILKFQIEFKFLLISFSLNYPKNKSDDHLPQRKTVTEKK